MLRNVLEDFLRNIHKERDFDSPFLALLSAMDYSDIHLTHGPSEKGKDFIAKKDGLQWVFQTKKGDLSTTDFNLGILGQLNAAAVTGLNHPSFNAEMSRQIVLVTTGKLTQPAADSVSSFSSDTLAPKGYPKAIVWQALYLVERFLEHGVEGLHASQLSEMNLGAQGKFFILYGSIVRGNPSLHDIEDHSLTWLNFQDVPSRNRILIGTLEASILTAKCRDGEMLYEAFYCALASLRMGMHELFHAQAGLARSELLALCRSQLEAALGTAKDYLERVWGIWESSERRLERGIKAASIFLAYPINCCRIIETMGLLALGSDSEAAKTWANRLTEFIEAEPGVSHPISDRYAVSIVVACLALVRAGHQDVSRKLVEKTVIWLCDRVEQGAGLAHLDATVQDEVDQILGFPFSGLNIETERSSFLASALIDLSAYLDDATLYSDVVNDLRAVEIHPEFYQPMNTVGQFLISHDDVRHYPGCEFQEELSSIPSVTNHSPYGTFEPPSYDLFAELGLVGYMSVSLLLRDRYFPSLWLLKPA